MASTAKCSTAVDKMTPFLCFQKPPKYQMNLPAAPVIDRQRFSRDQQRE